MGISNYTPNSRISQAGVIPNAAARPASPYAGQLVYQLDTNQLLVWDGTAWRFGGISSTAESAAMDSIGLWKIGTFTASGTSRALVCDNIFTSDYTSYKVIIRLGSTTSLNFGYVQGINTAGATVTSGYGASAYLRDYFTGTTGVTVFTSSSNSVIPLGAIANAIGNSTGAELTINYPRTSGVWVVGYGQTTGIYSGSAFLAGEIYFENNSGNFWRGLRFDNGQGSNLTGTVTVYGYRD